MIMDKRKVVVFDSGVGGLTTLKYLQGMLPHEEYVYFGDYDNNPYKDWCSRLDSIGKRTEKLNEYHFEYSDNLMKRYRNLPFCVFIVCFKIKRCCTKGLRWIKRNIKKCK